METAFSKLKKEKGMTEHYLKEVINTIESHRHASGTGVILTQGFSRNPDLLSKLEKFLGAEKIEEENNEDKNSLKEKFKTIFKRVILVKGFLGGQLSEVLITFPNQKEWERMLEKQETEEGSEENREEIPETE